MVRIEIGGNPAALILDTAPLMSAENVNAALVAQLSASQGMPIGLTGDCTDDPLDPDRKRIKVNAAHVTWDDTDSGIKTVGIMSSPGVRRVRAIPTLSQWGLILLATLLATAALLLIRRRRRSMEL